MVTIWVSKFHSKAITKEPNFTDIFKWLKPLSEPLMNQFSAAYITHMAICISEPQWVNLLIYAFAIHQHNQLHRSCWCAILIAHQIVMAKHGGSCVHFSGISTCGRTSRETVSHPQCPPLPTLCKISLPIYVIVTNKLLQPLTTTWYDSLVLSFSFLKNLTTFN